MLSTKRIVVILLAVNYCLAEQKFLNDRDIKRIKDPELKHSLDIDETGIELLHREKRGWGSVIFSGVSMLVKATSLGLTLGSALSEGCMYYPSICRNKDEIARLDGEIKTMTSKYEEEYMHSKERYYNLKTATTNNGYIDYYINQTLQAVEKLQGIEEDLTLLLEIKLPKLSQMAAATTNETYEQYLGHAVGTLEYRLTDLKQMLLEYKKSALLGIVVQFVIEATVNKFISAIQTAYKQVLSSEDILASTSDELWSRMDGSRVRNTNTKFGVVKKLKMAPKVLKQMGKNFGESLRSFGKNIKKWTAIKTWKGFKGKLKSTFKSPLQKLKNAKDFFSPSKNKLFVKNYRLSWSQKAMMGIGIIADGISTALQVKQWHDVADKMDKAREDYQHYHNNLTNELETIANETVKMEGIWTDVVHTFQHLSLPFKQLVENSTNFSNFSDVIGLPRLPVDTSDPLFTIDFNSITKQSIRSQQINVIEFLKKVSNNMTEIHDKMLARTVLYNNTLSKSEIEETVGDMQSDIKSILKFSPSRTMRTFGDSLTLADTVCTVSILRYDLIEYDYFPIDSFRPRCDVNATTFDRLNRQAYTKRKSKLMRDVIVRYLNSSQSESLSMLVDAVHNAYSGVADKHIATFGKSIAEQDVICVLVDTFANLSIYDFINLSSLRPDCSTVSTGQFHKVLEDAKKLRDVTLAVKAALDGCIQYKFCPCLSTVASTNQVAEKDIVYAVHHIDPSWQPNKSAQFCGPTGCGCSHL
ncbi:uncharacterized protein LOC134726030 [Mytilus trossulus]|uniref:uncharacterized protein LOC134726030 n=1 Tax=Mytilus trossulus TaxID=6551 RepID=UPI003004A02B